MKNIHFIKAVFLVMPVILAVGCGETESPAHKESLVAPTTVIINPAKLGGDTSVATVKPNSFSLNSANMSASRKGEFLMGNDFFEDPWVIAPSTTHLRDGLGPLFNVSACQSCHFNDGRGHAPESTGDDANSLLIRLSRPPKSATDEAELASPMVANLGDPVYGGQLQDRAIPGVLHEGLVAVDYQVESVAFADGFTVELRKPTWRIVDWQYGEPTPDLTLSVRVASPVIGLGLLEVIASKDLLSHADPLDNDGDGISGRANMVWDVGLAKQVVGRFGWKAGQPTVKQQTAGALNGDMGLTTSLFQNDHCTSAQSICQQMESGVDEAGVAEVRDDILELISFYARNLAVPERRSVGDAITTAGEALFKKANCHGCHIEHFQTPELLASYVEQSQQTIFPYTDLLLHDMGAALADSKLDGQIAPQTEVVEYDATAYEWRTPPLWGIGLTKVVNANATFLHDGRARTILEAVLWHGGEAEQAKQEVLAFTAAEREAFLAFLHSL